MNERKYYYIVECSNGINRMSTFMRAKNHWEAEDLARNEYHKKFLAWPTDVESRKSTKTECDNIFDDMKLPLPSIVPTSEISDEFSDMDLDEYDICVEFTNSDIGYSEQYLLWDIESFKD